MNVFQINCANISSMVGKGQAPIADLFVDLHQKTLCASTAQLALLARDIEALLQSEASWVNQPNSFFGLTMRIPVTKDKVEEAWKITKFKARRPDMILGRFKKTEPVVPIEGGFIRTMDSLDGQVHFDENVWIDDETKTVLFEEITQPVRFFAVNRIVITADKAELIALYLIGNPKSNPSQFSTFMLETPLPNMNQHAPLILQELYRAHYEDNGKARPVALK